MSAFSFSISSGISLAAISAVRSTLRVISSVFPISLTMVFGIMPCFLLYSSCTARRRSVSRIARSMLPVTTSAYMTTFPSLFRAARPMV